MRKIYSEKRKTGSERHTKRLVVLRSGAFDNVYLFKSACGCVCVVRMPVARKR